VIGFAPAQSLSLTAFRSLLIRKVNAATQPIKPLRTIWTRCTNKRNGKPGAVKSTKQR